MAETILTVLFWSGIILSAVSVVLINLTLNYAVKHGLCTHLDAIELSKGAVLIPLFFLGIASVASLIAQ